MYSLKKQFGILFFCLLTVPVVLFAQEPSTASSTSWITLEKGKYAFRQRHLGDALLLFRQALAREGTHPEAEFWIGAVFEEEGEYELALKQYYRALEQKKYLYILDEEIGILYKIARIYNLQRRYASMEKILLQITARDEVFNATAEGSQRERMVRTLLEKGLNHLLILYRVNSEEALEAHIQLGLHYYRNRRYEKSLEHLLFSFASMMTLCADELRIRDPEYSFTTIRDALRKGYRIPRVYDFLSQSNIYQVLYHMGLSLFGQGELARALSLWDILRNLPQAEEWAVKADRQYQKPSLEIP